MRRVRRSLELHKTGKVGKSQISQRSDSIKYRKPQKVLSNPTPASKNTTTRSYSSQKTTEIHMELGYLLLPAGASQEHN